MTDYYTYLRSLLVGESKAYGFTIAFWGSGAMLINQHGIPNLTEALSFGFGAVLGFGILTIIAFQGAFNHPKSTESEYLVLSTIHYIAALLPIIATSLIASNISGLPSFLLAGASVSLIFNSSMLIENYLSKELYTIEKKTQKLIS